MDILKGVPQSVLWLSYRNDPTSNNLRKEAQARGVDPARIIFARRMDDVGEHMARLKCADLFLDTYPYNAHTTATAALWAGLPVLTRTGESFASRVAASLLSTCQIPELIVRTPEEYQALAIDLGNKLRKHSVTGCFFLAASLTCPVLFSIVYLCRIPTMQAGEYYSIARFFDSFVALKHIVTIGFDNNIVDGIWSCVALAAHHIRISGFDTTLMPMPAIQPYL
jgi:hypothetical protein